MLNWNTDKDPPSPRVICENSLLIKCQDRDKLLSTHCYAYDSGLLQEKRRFKAM